MVSGAVMGIGAYSPTHGWPRDNTTRLLESQIQWKLHKDTQHDRTTYIGARCSSMMAAAFNQSILPGSLTLGGLLIRSTCCTTVRHSGWATPIIRRIKPQKALHDIPRGSKTISPVVISRWRNMARRVRSEIGKAPGNGLHHLIS